MNDRRALRVPQAGKGNGKLRTQSTQVQRVPPPETTITGRTAIFGVDDLAEFRHDIFYGIALLLPWASGREQKIWLD